MKKKSYKRLVSEDGGFKSDFPGGIKGKPYSVGYFQDLCEWIYYHSNMTDEEKMKSILDMEGIIKDILSDSDIFGITIEYIPNWSKKLERKIARNKKNE